MFKSLIFASLLAAGSAHQNFHQFWVNDVSPGFEVGVRMPPSNSPVTDVASNDIVCNVPRTNTPAGGVATVPVAAGDKITVQWDQSGHPGPISHMLFGPIASAALATGVGEWVKIDELTSVDGKWANEIMGAADMKHTFTLPANLASGEYLLRSEMLALHGAQTVGGAQFYIGCAQIKVTGPGGSCGPKITLPGAYDPEEAGIYIPNVYNGFDLTTYVAPGGPVAVCAAGSGGSAPAPTTLVTATKPAATSAVASSSAVVSIPASSSAGSTTLPIATTTQATLPTTIAESPAITPSTTLAPVITSPVASSTKTACKVKSTTTAAPVIPAPSASKTACKSKTASAGVSATLPSSSAPVVTPSASAPVAAPSASAAPGSAIASIYAQCGGVNYTGPTVCATGATCVKSNDFYSQCIRA